MKRFCKFVRDLVQNDDTPKIELNGEEQNQEVPSSGFEKEYNRLKMIEVDLNTTLDSLENLAGDDVAPSPAEAPQPASTCHVAPVHGQGDVETLTQTEDNGNNDSDNPEDTLSWEPKTKEVKISSDAQLDSDSNNTAATMETVSVIHPLQNTWSLWFFKHDRSQNWHENVRHVISFSSVEDFWSIFQNLMPVSGLPPGCDYFLFKANIQPMWEDRANLNGGRWIYKLDRDKEVKQTLDRLWMETLLALIGESFDQEAEQICGAVAQVRRNNDKLCMWTRCAADRTSCLRVGRRWKKLLPNYPNLVYEAHEDSQNRTYHCNLYVV